MKIEERKEVTHTTIESVIVGRKCDVCGNDIKPITYPMRQYNYFVIHTHHSDWGNDSVDSHEYYDACSPDCVMKFSEKYVKDSYDRISNSKVIEISHVRRLEDGACDY